MNLVVLMILGLPALLFGRQGVFFMARTWAVSSIWLLEKICGLRLEFRGVENMPHGGYILAAKHQSFLETFALVTQTPDFAIILKKSLKCIPVFGLYLTVSGQIGIDRSQGPQRAGADHRTGGARCCARDGRSTSIPRARGGRRAPNRNTNTASRILYEATGAPCLPVALNTGVFWGRRGFLRRPGRGGDRVPARDPGGARPRKLFSSGCKSEIETAHRPADRGGGRRPRA